MSLDNKTAMFGYVVWMLHKGARMRGWIGAQIQSAFPLPQPCTLQVGSHIGRNAFYLAPELHLIAIWFTYRGSTCSEKICLLTLSAYLSVFCVPFIGAICAGGGLLTQIFYVFFFGVTNWYFIQIYIKCLFQCFGLPKGSFQTTLTIFHILSKYLLIIVLRITKFSKLGFQSYLSFYDPNAK